MDVFGMMDKIGIVADGVFPIAALPNCLLPFLLTALGPVTFSELSNMPASELLFNAPPAKGVTGVAVWQCPQRMEMIGENDLGLDLERVAALNRCDG